MAFVTAASSVHPLGGLATFVPATSTGDHAHAGNGMALLVMNLSAAPMSVTVAVPDKDGPAVTASPLLSIPAGKMGVIPLYDVFRGTDGFAHWTYSASANVHVAVAHYR